MTTAAMDMRVGHGFDVHRFAAEQDDDKPLILAGVTLPEPYSLEAHSDGDLVLHAVCDAILGAMGAGDIGLHFPDTDPRFAGADSGGLLEHVLELADAEGFRLVNTDITVVAQRPRLAAYRGEMVTSLSALLRLQPSRVNLKATTTERLGYVGREEGIACHCVVLMHHAG